MVLQQGVVGELLVGQLVVLLEGQLQQDRVMEGISLKEESGLCLLV